MVFFGLFYCFCSSVRGLPTLILLILVRSYCFLYPVTLCLLSSHTQRVIQSHSAKKTPGIFWFYDLENLEISWDFFWKSPYNHVTIIGTVLDHFQPNQMIQIGSIVEKTWFLLFLAILGTFLAILGPISEFCQMYECCPVLPYNNRKRFRPFRVVTAFLKKKIQDFPGLSYPKNILFSRSTTWNIILFSRSLQNVGSKYYPHSGRTLSNSVANDS